MNKVENTTRERRVPMTDGANGTSRCTGGMVYKETRRPEREKKPRRREIPVVVT
jgi:hypothetical protein